MKFFKKIIATLLIVLVISDSAFALPLCVDPVILEKEKAKIVKLETTFNTRDLGGYETLTGEVTKKGVFLRSDDTDELTESDIKTLQNEKKVTLCIDLRGTPQTSLCEVKDKLESIPGIKYCNVDMLKIYKLYSKDDQPTTLDESFAPKFLKYTDRGNWQKEIFDAIAKAEDGCALFHCAAGKDRTGLVAMLLLGFVNVSDQDIMYNYSVSWDLVKNRPKIKQSVEEKIKIFEKAEIFKNENSSPEKIRAGIDYIKGNYGNFENYLLQCGVSQENLNKIKSRFIDKK